MKSDAIIGAIQGVTKKWAKQRKAEERDASARLNRRYIMTRRYHISLKDAAWQVMKEAYLKASAGGTLPAHARQIMYAARPHIQRTADKQIGKGFDQYFTQTLLPDYMRDHPTETQGWNVVFDARGHFHEPHTEEEVPLGTLQVRDYLARIRQHGVDDLDFNVWEKHYPTLGPGNRFSAILFIEKEGFMPLFKEVRLAERYDLAIMSTKGMSVTAARLLVETLCADHDVPLLVLHDFDKAGFSIAGTMQRDTRRYSFSHEINVIDLGMHLGDIDGLETEDVYIKSPFSARENLRENGATEEEIEFLLEQRVELNAFASDDFVAWIEAKLDEQGVTKIVPDNDCLATAYRRATQQALVQKKIDEVVDDIVNLDDEEASIPEDLRKKVDDRIREDTTVTWDSIVREIAIDNLDDEEDDG
jgi:hypothetical protein